MNSGKSLKLGTIKKLSTVLLDSFLPLLCLFLIPIALYCSFIFAPAEKVMGSVQRILYFHVGSAMASYLMLGVLFVGSVCYLTWRDLYFYHISRAAASVALLFGGIVLFTGMLWGYSSWNTWWNWEPRLVSMLVLWIFLLSYTYVQSISFSGDSEKAVISSVLGILCAVQVPIVIFSIKLLDRTQQLHPEVVATQGLTSAGYRIALIVSNFAMLFLSILLCRMVYRIVRVEWKTTHLKRQVLIKESK